MGLGPSYLSRTTGQLQHPPRGYIPILVGLTDKEARRLIVHVTAFSDGGFIELLRESAEEFGFRHEGILRLPVTLEDFEKRMRRGLKRKMRWL
ncbi:hypothetical protein MLD38_005181 [Melastoma candidum]|uniref:Uncharacterized protein n=1 Tax=Melastoma candidum TaxID=119954 RepID=A0ACB9S7X7_9MYRT|nr:hypothetical protein MLD38_005181 [Melastoma candidum]